MRISANKSRALYYRFHLNLSFEHKINIDMQIIQSEYIRFDCCACRFNLKSIKTTLAGCRFMRSAEANHHGCMEICWMDESVCIVCECVNVYRATNPSYKFTLNVIYMVVWPTHLIENCPALIACQPIWRLHNMMDLEWKLKPNSNAFQTASSDKIKLLKYKILAGLPLLLVLALISSA